METDPTQLPTTETTPQNERTVEVFSHEENMLNVSEALRGDIETIHNESSALVERATANPITDRIIEQGANLGLSEDEVSALMQSGAYHEKDEALREKAQAIGKSFADRLKESARIGVAAFAIGSSMPVVAEEAPIDHGVNLKMADELEKQTYENVSNRLKNSITLPTEMMSVSVKKEGEEEFTPTAVVKGTSLGINFDRRIVMKEMENATSDIELVHTHPLSTATSQLGGLDANDLELFARGQVPNVTISPSSDDLRGILNLGADRFPAEQFSGRVETPSGKWDFGVEDRGSSYIEGMRKAQKEIQEMRNAIIFTEEEEAFITKLYSEKNQNVSAGQLLLQSNDPRAQSIIDKLISVDLHLNGIVEKNIHPDDLRKMENFDNINLKAWVHPGTTDGDAEIMQREQVAKELGFRMKYTPNPVLPKVENTPNDVILQKTDMIDPARLDALGTKYPYIDQYGNQLNSPLSDEKMNTKE